jgi:hypothetical protein
MNNAWNAWRREQVPDVINLVLGAILFLSPWIFGFVSEYAAGWNAWLSGIIVCGLAIAALAAFAEWEEWLNLIVGIWVVISPWLVSASPTVTWLHFVLGVAVAAIAAVRIWLMRNPPRVTA